MESMTGNTHTTGPISEQLAFPEFPWEAIRVTRFAALQALNKFEPGSVVVDPIPHAAVLYFFIKPGTALRWDAPHSVLLSNTENVAVPSPDRQAPPGLYWLTPPAENGRVRLTSARALCRALEAALHEAPTSGAVRACTTALRFVCTPRTAA